MAKFLKNYHTMNMLNAAKGTGIIMGRRLLLEIGPHLRGCAQNDILTDHEDIELGRCIWRKLGIGCTNALDAKQLFFNNFRHDKNAELGYFDNIKSSLCFCQSRIPY